MIKYRVTYLDGTEEIVECDFLNTPVKDGNLYEFQRYHYYENSNGERFKINRCHYAVNSSVVESIRLLPTD